MNMPFADAQAAFPFVIAHGRNLEAKIYETRYPVLNYADFVPVVTEGNQWSVGTTFFTVDTDGQAKFLSGAANDMPFVSATHDQGTRDFHMIGAGWEWTIEEVNQSALYNFPLSDLKANQSVRAVETLLYSIAMTGSTEKNWGGLTNYSGITTVDVAADGTGSSRLWTSKTGAQIVRDINDLLGSIQSNTAEVEWADTLALPPAAFRYISSMEYGTGNGTLTILEYVKRNNVYTAQTNQQLDIKPLRDLRTAATDGSGRMVAYRNDPDVLRFHMPMPRTVFAPRQKSIMGFEQGVVARTGGLEVRLPGAVAYGDKIAVA